MKRLQLFWSTPPENNESFDDFVVVEMDDLDPTMEFSTLEPRDRNASSVETLPCPSPPPQPPPKPPLHIRSLCPYKRDRCYCLLFGKKCTEKKVTSTVDTTQFRSNSHNV